MHTYLDTAPHILEGIQQFATGEGTGVLEYRIGKKGEAPIWSEVP